MEKILEFNCVDFSYNKIARIKNLSFELYSGESVGIIGKSGIGKTTIASLIMNFIKQTSGRIERLYKNSRYCFQDARLIPWLTISQNINFGVNNFDLCFFNELIKQLELEDLIDKFPNEISGGQRHRVAIARSLYAKPDLIIFDESFSALDQKIKNKIINYLKELQISKKISYLVISHSKDEIASLCDRAINI